MKVKVHVMDCSEEFEMLKNKISNPPLIAEKDQYMIRFANTPEEVESALRLRYRVFNIEQGKGLEASDADGIDKDEYDDISLHLIVREKNTLATVGTYRIILAQQSGTGMDVYSAREFNISGMKPLLPDTLEVGRSCVDPAYRNGTVVALLWAGISEIMARSGMRYLFGCVSLEDTRSAAAWLLYDDLKTKGLVHETIYAEPKKEFFLPRPSDEEVEKFKAEEGAMRRICPPLFKGYLRMGAKICGPPAYDYEFGTLDFFIILDVAALPERYKSHFNVHGAGVENKI